MYLFISDMTTEISEDITNFMVASKIKTGYLTKKGQNYKTWHKRFLKHDEVKPNNDE